MKAREKSNVGMGANDAEAEVEVDDLVDGVRTVRKSKVPCFLSYSCNVLQHIYDAYRYPKKGDILEINKRKNDLIKALFQKYECNDNSCPHPHCTRSLQTLQMVRDTSLSLISMPTYRLEQ